MQYSKDLLSRRYIDDDCSVNIVDDYEEGSDEEVIDLEDVEDMLNSIQEDIERVGDMLDSIKGLQEIDDVKKVVQEMYDKCR